MQIKFGCPARPRHVSTPPKPTANADTPPIIRSYTWFTLFGAELAATAIATPRRIEGPDCGRPVSVTQASLRQPSHC
jgi:hypothetical protein